MHHEIDLAPLLLKRVEDRVDGGFVADVTVAGHEAVDFREQRLDALFQSVALIGQRNFTTLRVDGLGNAPCDGTVVCNAHDDAALALHQTGCLSHGKSPILFPATAGAGAKVHKCHTHPTERVRQIVENCLWHSGKGGSSAPEIRNC
ncbi:hypothetical protein D3C87_1705770 [compost metagenome]